MCNSNRYCIPILEFKIVLNEWCVVALTINSDCGSFLGDSVQVRVFGLTGVVPRMHSVDLGDGKLWSSVDLGVVVKPNILTWGVRGGLTHKGDISFLKD